MKDEGAIAAVTILLVLAAVLLLFTGPATPTKPVAAQAELETLASCLKSRGVLLYGAFWCPYCAKQKEAFGNAARLLPYVECSSPDGRSQTAVCIEQGIRKYPTWVFPDGSRVNARLNPQALAEKSGCAAPKE